MKAKYVMENLIFRKQRTSGTNGFSCQILVNKKANENYCTEHGIIAPALINDMGFASCAAV
jgi:hypothetical protein